MSDGFTKNDSGKTRFGLLPPLALKAIADVLTHGAAKYTSTNWCQAEGWSRYVDALLRHLNAWQAGEDLDPDSGLLHLAHAGCCVLFLLTFQIHGIGKDDRICRDIEQVKQKQQPPTEQRTEQTANRGFGYLLRGGK